VLSFDSKGIAMRLADLREATRKKAEAARANRTRTRLASGEKANAKRMAEVAAVYTLKQWPRTIEDVLHGLRSKATEARRPRPAGGQPAGNRADPMPLIRFCCTDPNCEVTNQGKFDAGGIAIELPDHEVLVVVTKLDVGQDTEPNHFEPITQSTVNKAAAPPA
jgi:hypothetical protein